MTLFRNVVFVAALAGLLAGLAFAAMQGLVTDPLILAAESYEVAGDGHETGTMAHDHAAKAEAAGAAQARAPRAGLERHAYGVVASVAGAIGLALLMVAVSELFGGIAGWRRGVLWGLAGFAAFTLAPGLGLPPELPAMPAADLAARQAWWLGTVAATAAGLGLIAFTRSAPLLALAIGLIALPHLVGAPQPAHDESPVPTDLHRAFVSAATVTSLVFWVLLGALAGALRNRTALASLSPPAADMPDPRRHPADPHEPPA